MLQRQENRGKQNEEACCSAYRDAIDADSI